MVGVWGFILAAQGMEPEKSPLGRRKLLVFATETSSSAALDCSEGGRGDDILKIDLGPKMWGGRDRSTQELWILGDSLASVQIPSTWAPVGLELGKSKVNREKSEHRQENGAAYIQEKHSRTRGGPGGDDDILA